jgi:RNA polymerase sigma-70 factor (ECF subfamily)
MNYAQQDDATLMRLIAGSETEALGELYDRYNRLVFSISFAIVGDRATAAEITLDVFTHIWQRAGTYRPEQAKVTTWLTAISRNRAIDILRQQNVRPESASVSWDSMATPPAKVAIQDIHALEEQVDLTLRCERVRAALLQLPMEQRQVLALAYFKGYTHRQIADILQQPLGTVKTRIRLAMQKLRRALAAYYNDEK